MAAMPIGHIFPRRSVGKLFQPRQPTAVKVTSFLPLGLQRIQLVKLRQSSDMATGASRVRRRQNQKVERVGIVRMREGGAVDACRAAKG